MNALGCYLLISLLFVFSTMLELALVLALDEIKKLETFEKIDATTVVKDNDEGKVIPIPIIKDINTITPKSGRKDHSKLIKDDGIAKLGRSGKFSRLLKVGNSRTFTSKISFGCQPTKPAVLLAPL